MRRLAGVLLAALLALPAVAYVPSADRIADAVARANAAAGRDEPILFEVQLRIGDGPPAASGVLVSHPTGLARLELRARSGFVERHLLQGDAYTASRDGQILSRPRPFLPPVFLLQSSSGAALQAALGSFGVAPVPPVLGRVGTHDCYVFGGRPLPQLAALPPVGEGPPGASGGRGADLPPMDGAGLPPEAPEPVYTPLPEETVPSLWVDLETFDVIRIDGRDGVRFRMGPTATFEQVRAPQWIEIQVPGSTPARLEVLRAAPANAPAAAFSESWLTGSPALP